jgi:hypothetical protein
MVMGRKLTFLLYLFSLKVFNWEIGIFNGFLEEILNFNLFRDYKKIYWRILHFIFKFVFLIFFSFVEYYFNGKYDGIKNIKILSKFVGKNHNKNY